MAQSQSSSSAPTPTPQQLNKITAQLRNLNKAYKAAVAANRKTKNSRPLLGEATNRTDRT